MGSEEVEIVGEKNSWWTIVGGAGRCEACVINVNAIVKWQEEFERGLVVARNPIGTNCQRCTTVKKQVCRLLVTEDMRRARKKKGKEKGKDKAKLWSVTLVEQQTEVGVRGGGVAATEAEEDGARE